MTRYPTSFRSAFPTEFRPVCTLPGCHVGFFRSITGQHRTTESWHPERGYWLFAYREQGEYASQDTEHYLIRDELHTVYADGSSKNDVLWYGACKGGLKSWSDTYREASNHSYGDLSAIRENALKSKHQ